MEGQDRMSRKAAQGQDARGDEPDRKAGEAMT